MEDREIVELFCRREQAAISETQKKYQNYCLAIAKNILYSSEDADEILNDTYTAAWNTIPPHRPEILSTYLGKITRRLSLKRLREKTAKKRGAGEIPAAFEELEECVPDRWDISQELEEKQLTALLNAFLEVLPEEERRVFLCRYWYCDSIREISGRFGFGQSKVKMMLKRTRDKLRECLEKEGVWL